MGYRGEDVSRTPADWGQQAPRQSSPGVGQGNAGSWVDGAQGYGNDDYDDYASDGTGNGYQRGDGYAPRPGGSGSYPALPDGRDGYQGRDAGNGRRPCRRQP